MTDEIDKLLAELSHAAKQEARQPPASSDFDADQFAAAFKELRSRKPTPPDQIALHRRLYREAKKHIAAVDAYNAANPHKQQQYLPQMLAYRGAFAYVEQET